MTFKRKRSEYECDICHRRGFWDEGTWTRYSSILLDETCPDDIPVACSSACATELKHRIDTGVIGLPTLKRGGYAMYVTKPAWGFGPFLKTDSPA